MGKITTLLKKSQVIIRVYQFLQKRMFLMNGEKILKKFKFALEKEKIGFWLDYGTLLGAVREKDFIEHDFDIDLGIKYFEGVEVIVTNALSNNKIKLIRELKVNGLISEQTFKYKGIRVDIFYYHLSNDTMYTHIFEDKYFEDKTWIEDNVKYYKNPKLYKVTFENRDIEKINFKGIDYGAPQNVNGYLIETYGSNYMIPIKEWDYVENPTNIREDTISEGLAKYYL